METQESILSLPVNFVPTPTQEYRGYRKEKHLTEAAGAPVEHLQPPAELKRQAFLPGPRVLIYEQDSTVMDPATGSTTVLLKKKFLPSFVSDGPNDNRIASAGMPPVSKNSFGDFIQTPGTDSFDTVQTFTVTRMALTNVQRALKSAGVANPIPWQWNAGSNTEPISVFAHGLPNTMNAFYQRSSKCLKFGDFIKPGSSPAQRIFTCRSLDIVAHETGHAILDALQPNWLSASAPVQTGGLHESFGDLNAIFLTLSQMDLVEGIIVQTKSNLHNKTFLADLAEEFGLALGRTNGLRNADNDFKLSEVGTEVHAISQVFTGAIYDILADIFAFERNISLKDDAQTLFDSAHYLFGLLLRSLIESPATNAVYVDVANQMLSFAAADNKPVQYRNFIRNRFALREIIVSPTPLTEDHKVGFKFEAPQHTNGKHHVQDRSRCCGTMKLEEYFDMSYLQDEINELKKFKKK